MISAMPEPDDSVKSRPVRQLMEGRHVQDSFKALFERYYPAVRSYFARRGFAPEDCRGLTQDVFAEVHTISGLHDEDAFSAWLFSIARHVAARHIPRICNPVCAASASVSDAGCEAPSPVPSPPGAVLDQEKTEVMRAAFEELPERMRQCVRARLLDDLSYREIGERLGISENTVAVQLRRAVRALRMRLKPFWGNRTFEEDL
jgi:RNA polymerase sigma-70 factor (ECF subfamily)